MWTPRTCERTKSQYGYVLGIVNGAFCDQSNNGVIHLVEYASATTKRMCRSTLSAEANALIEAAEAAEWLRAVMLELRAPDFNLALSDDHARRPRVLWLTDAKSLYDMLSRDCGLAQDKRLRTLIAQLRQMLRDDFTSIQWIGTMLMLDAR